MRDGFRQSMAWLHTWAGLIVGWLLLAIFLTGTASYYRSEITGWMHPEIQHLAPASEADALRQAMDWLQTKAPNANAWLIDLPSERLPATQVMWQGVGERRYNSELLNPSSDQAFSPRKTFGGDFFYAFHYQLSLPPLIGRWIVGVASMAMFIAIISGVITHRRIFKDFFTFRPGKGQRSWLDAHNTLSVLALPFHVLITYTGLVTLMFLYVPWGIDLLYGKDSTAFYRDIRDYSAPPAPAPEPAQLASSTRLIEQARQHWGDGHIARVSISSPGAANARIELTRDTQDQISSLPQRLVLDGTTGELTEAIDPAGPAKIFYGVLYGLHLAHFADPLLRALLFISGLGGTAMIATGLQLWVVKRRDRAPGWLYRRIEGLNVAAILGLPLAMASFFWGNRLVPGDLPGRDVYEVLVFFSVWLLMLLHAQLRPVHRAWREQAQLCTLAFIGLPLLDIATGPDAVNGFNLVSALLGLGFAFVVRRLQRKRAPQPSTLSPRRSKPTT